MASCPRQRWPQGLADKPWTLARVVKLIEDRENTAADMAKGRKDRRMSKRPTTRTATVP